MTLRQQAGPRPALAAALGERLRLLPPLLPTVRSRRIAAALIVISVVVVAVIGALVHGGRLPSGLDRAVSNLLQRHRGTVAGNDLLAAATLGSSAIATALTILLAFVFLALRRYFVALLVALSVPIAAAVSESVLKPLVHRTLDGFLTYPSGHSTALFALITCIAIVLLASRDVAAPRALGVVLTVIAVAIGCALCLGLVLAHMHYFTDTIGGAATGTGSTLAVAFGIDFVTARTLRRPAMTPRAGQPADPVSQPRA